MRMLRSSHFNHTVTSSNHLIFLNLCIVFDLRIVADYHINFNKNYI